MLKFVVFFIPKNGERHPRRGFWGDMIVSPYVTFGVESEDKSFYKKQNQQHVKVKLVFILFII